MRWLQQLAPWMLICALVLVPRAAEGDPLTTGSFHVWGPPFGWVPGGHVSGLGGVRRSGLNISVNENGFAAMVACYPCAGGEALSFTGSFASWGSRIDLLSDAFVLPKVFVPSPFDSQQAWLTQMPFRYAASWLSPYDNLLHTISGVGIVTGAFRASQTDRGTEYRFTDAWYEFGDEVDAAPVPEPGTLLLISAGVMVGWRRFKRLPSSAP